MSSLETVIGGQDDVLVGGVRPRRHRRLGRRRRSEAPHSGPRRARSDHERDDREADRCETSGNGMRHEGGMYRSVSNLRRERPKLSRESGRDLSMPRDWIDGGTGRSAAALARGGDLKEGRDIRLPNPIDRVRVRRHRHDSLRLRRGSAAMRRRGFCCGVCGGRSRRGRGDAAFFGCCCLARRGPWLERSVPARSRAISAFGARRLRRFEDVIFDLAIVAIGHTGGETIQSDFGNGFVPISFSIRGQEFCVVIGRDQGERPARQAGAAGAADAMDIILGSGSARRN